MSQSCPLARIIIDEIKKVRQIQLFFILTNNPTQVKKEGNSWNSYPYSITVRVTAAEAPGGSACSNYFGGTLMKRNLVVRTK